MEPAVLGSEAVGSSADGSGCEPDARRQLLAVLGELLSLTAGLLPDRVTRDLASARARVAGNRFNLVVLGEFKRGKSTLINALLDRDLLPTGVVPLTSVVTAIRAGDRDRMVVHFNDGSRQARPVTELADYVTEARNPGNRLGVELARVEIDHELLRAGLELVDTPGIGSIHGHNTEAARAFLPRVDAALCVLDAGQPLSQAERELFIDAADRVPRLLIVINKLDHLDLADHGAAVGFVRSALTGLLGDASPELFAVSARQREGLAPLVARLRKLAGQERELLLHRSVAGLALGVGINGAQAARFESHAIELPLDELAARARQFEQRITELTAASAEAGELLARGVQRALDQHVNQPLKDHAHRESARLHTALREHVQALGQCSPRELSVELDGWIAATVQGDFAQLVPDFEATIAQALTELERRYTTRVQRILEQVQAAAEDVFGTRASELLPAIGLREPSRFSFKLDDVEHALDIIVGFGRTIAPGGLGRRLVLRDAEQRLIEMTDRHAGRLRSELAHRVSNATRDYQRELAAVVDSAVDAIRAAIERATEDHRRGEQHTRARLERLKQVEGRCEQLTTELDRWLANGPVTPVPPDA